MEYEERVEAEHMEPERNSMIMSVLKARLSNEEDLLSNRVTESDNENFKDGRFDSE